MSDPHSSVKILGISGSLRKASHNTALLKAVADVLPEGVTLEFYTDLREIPPYDDDVRVESGFPPAVEALRTRIRQADALLFCSPEYNFTIPGALKNAIDWASRPPEQPFEDKPALVMGASPGNFGTIRMQNHFRLMAVFLNMHLLNKPGVMVARAHEKFDAEGRLTDLATRKVLGEAVVALAGWTRRLRGF